jgi:hypothetical protein
VGDDITKMSVDQLKAFGITRNGKNYTTGGTTNNGTFTAGTQALGKFASIGKAFDEVITGADEQQYYDGTNWYNMHSMKDASGNYVW